jgi:hypothetical protein
MFVSDFRGVLSFERDFELELLSNVEIGKAVWRLGDKLTAFFSTR